MGPHRQLPNSGHSWSKDHLTATPEGNNNSSLTRNASEHIQGCTAMAQLLCGAAHLSPDPPGVQGDDNEPIVLQIIC